jgi:SAM-dependent methyltransferase
MKQLIAKVPIVGSIARIVYHKWIGPPKPFPGSEKYWIQRYDSGGNSGDGSYRKLAKFKAEILNEFVLQESVKTIIEYGCGDGNQLKLANYSSYLGFDVSPKAIALCKGAFSEDPTKTFKMMNDYEGETAELTLSLDVIYHLIEEEVFSEYMNKLFDSSEKFVVVYSSNTNKNAEAQPGHVSHVRHWKFTEWVARMKPEWRLVKQIPNKYPYRGDNRTGSLSDFFIYERG